MLAPKDAMELLNIMTDLDISVDGKVAILSLNRPEKLNALRTLTFNELRSTVLCIRDDPSIRAVILTGKGRAFCSGADIAEYSSMKSVRDFLNFQENGERSYSALSTLEKPVIGAVNGYSLGGGFELALCCDVIIASQVSVFGFPEINLGLIPGGGTTVRLPIILGAFRSKDLFMSGRYVTAEEAHEMGIVSQVLPGELLMKSALRYANKLVAMSPKAIASVKRLVNIASYQHNSEHFKQELAEISELYGTVEAKEKIRSFISKQKRV